MIHRILFLPPASADVQQAVNWYNRQQTGLAEAYLADLARQLKRISHFPEIYPRLNATCRRAQLQRFPYTIVYRIHSTDIQVIAVVHHRSDPDVTQERAASE